MLRSSLNCEMAWGVCEHKLEFVSLCQQQFNIVISPFPCGQILKEHHDVLYRAHHNKNTTARDIVLT